MGSRTQVEKAEEREANTERARSADAARAHRLAAAIHSEVERDQQGDSPHRCALVPFVNPRALLHMG